MQLLILPVKCQLHATFVSFIIRYLHYIIHTQKVACDSYKPITNMTWVCALQKMCTRLAAASDKVYHLLAHGRWFSMGTPSSSTTKTGRHDIAEILLKVALNTINQIIKLVEPCNRALNL